MSDLTEHPQVREAFRRFTVGGSYDGMSLGDSVLRAKNELVSAIVSAHRSTLAGETEQETLEKAARALRLEMLNDYPPGTPNVDPTWEELDDETREGWMDAVRVIAPILRAPLLLQLQDKEERVKALEAALEAHAGCLATDRCPACSAIPEAR